MIKITDKISHQLAFFGFLLGAYGGFMTRDEYYQSSFDKMDQLSVDYNIKKDLLILEKKQVNRELEKVEEEERQLKMKQNKAKSIIKRVNPNNSSQKSNNFAEGLDTSAQK